MVYNELIVLPLQFGCAYDTITVGSYEYSFRLTQHLLIIYVYVLSFSGGVSPSSLYELAKSSYTLSLGQCLFNTITSPLPNGHGINFECINL